MRMRRVARLATALALAAALPATAGQAGNGAPADDDPGWGAPAIFWAGETWLPRVEVGEQKPYGNHWSASPDTIYVDSQDRLHLWIREFNGVWNVGEIRSVRQDYGYGTYTFVVETPIDAMDPHEVLGLFTRNNLPTEHELTTGTLWTDGQQGDPRYVDHAELDVEIGKWDWAGRGYPHRNAQYVVQPWWVKGHTKHLWLPHKVPYTVQMTWNRDNTIFKVWKGTSPTGRPASRWKSTATNGTPRPGTQVMLEAWLIFERGPARGVDQEVVIDSFRYEPSDG